MTDYGNTTWNKGRITQKAICALLADVYLWRASYKAGQNTPFTNLTEVPENLPSREETYSTTAESDYQKCVEYCDKIIEMTKEERIKWLTKRGVILGGVNVELTLENLLEQNEVGQTNSTSDITFSHSEPIAYTVFLVKQLR